MTFVNLMQTVCMYTVTKAFVAEMSCAIDCFLLPYHLKVSNMSIVHGSDLYNIKSVHCVAEKVGLSEACTNGC